MVTHFSARTIARVYSKLVKKSPVSTFKGTGSHLYRSLWKLIKIQLVAKFVGLVKNRMCLSLRELVTAFLIPLFDMIILRT